MTLVLISASLAKNLIRSTNIVSATTSSSKKIVRPPGVRIFQPRRWFYQPDRHGCGYETKKPKTELEWLKYVYKNIREGFQHITGEFKLWAEEMKVGLRVDRQWYFEDGTFHKEFEFRGEECLKNWTVSTDRDWGEGFSKAELTVSKQNMALFRGNLCCDVPDKGVVGRAGYANMKSIKKTKSFQRDDRFRWEPYTHLIGRVRGDGRSYVLCLYVDGDIDVSWNDTYHYFLHTRGGPYWQYVKIPFSRFFLGYQGSIQDRQEPIHKGYVSAIGITVMDTYEGPFQLEIDYLGVLKQDAHKDTFVYEQYTMPGFGL